jgi:hypothetical protein
MKTIITLTFFLFSFLGFSQTTREEVVQRDKFGQKSVVNTYTGTGNSEKLIKRTYYDVWEFSKSISIKPIQIDYFGNYKIVFSDGEVRMLWGAIKIEEYNTQGVLVSTWKISEKNDSQSTYIVIP